MSWIHLHLATNHLPVVGLPIALALLIVAICRGSEELKRVSIWTILILCLAAIGINFTGDFAADDTKGLAGIEESWISKHEDSADQAVSGAFVLGIVAAVGLWRSRKKAVPTWAVIGCLVLSIMACLLFARTANAGGQIRHPEIRSQ